MALFLILELAGQWARKEKFVQLQAIGSRTGMKIPCTIIHNDEYLGFGQHWSCSGMNPHSSGWALAPLSHETGDVLCASSAVSHYLLSNVRISFEGKRWGKQAQWCGGTIASQRDLLEPQPTVWYVDFAGSPPSINCIGDDTSIIFHGTGDGHDEMT
jgi:hypothetical protein